MHPACHATLSISRSRCRRTRRPGGLIRCPAGWELHLAYTRRVGDDWLASAATALFLVPETMNVLINPLHPAAASFRIVGTFQFPLDARLLKGAASDA